MFAHRDTHKDLQCDKCPEVLKNHEALKLHMMTHTTVTYADLEGGSVEEDVDSKGKPKRSQAAIVRFLKINCTDSYSVFNISI